MEMHYACANLNLQCKKSHDCSITCKTNNCILPNTGNNGFDNMYFKLIDVIHQYDKDYQLFQQNASN